MYAVYKGISNTNSSASSGYTSNINSSSNDITMTIDELEHICIEAKVFFDYFNMKLGNLDHTSGNIEVSVGYYDGKGYVGCYCHIILPSVTNLHELFDESAFKSYNIVEGEDKILGPNYKTLDARKEFKIPTSYARTAFDDISFELRNNYGLKVESWNDDYNSKTGHGSIEREIKNY